MRSPNDNERPRRPPLAAKDVLLAQDKWIKWSAISSAIVAIATSIYMATMVGVLWQMRDDTNLQREYYEKTVRPFVYIDRWTVVDVEQPLTVGSKIRLEYHIKNGGALPAKDVWIGSSFHDQVSEQFKRDGKADVRPSDLRTASVTALYPQQEFKSWSARDQSLLTIDTLSKAKFVHVGLTYSDAGEKTYFHKSIVELRLSIETEGLKWNAVNMWSDFD
jgi:hypothetical protein